MTRVVNGKSLSKVYNANIPLDRHGSRISCHDVNKLKSESSGDFNNSTEPIIVKCLSYYLDLDEFGKNEAIQLFWGPRYKGIAGNNQEIDISIEQNGNLLFGISIKTSFGGGYLEANDLDLTLIKEYKNNVKRFEKGGSVSDVLQDLARIQNIKENTNDFNSITILFSKPSNRKWTEKFTSDKHNYIFLEDNQNMFFGELESKLPGLIDLKSKNIST